MSSRKTPVYSGTKAYRAWGRMKDRCYSAKHDRYALYGGRGIKVCSNWLESFENFLADVGHPPSEQHSLDRIDVNGNYEPGNVRWATTFEQQRNKTNNRMLTAFGETKPVIEWLEDSRCFANMETLYKRVQYGWKDEDCIAKPMRDRKNRKHGPGCGNKSLR